jgi:DNA topoisomerase VI subunit B
MARHEHFYKLWRPEDAMAKLAKRRPHSDPDRRRIRRVAFETSRLMEFCSKRELVNQTGHQVAEWPLVIVKELVDNALDACEEAEIAPVITVTLTTRKRRHGTEIVITDNGPGIPTKTVTGVIDYSVRVSSREVYASPTRGAQGNALKTILPMGYVLSNGRPNKTLIEAHGIAHAIRFAVDQIRQEPMISIDKSPSDVRVGTRITVWWPDTYIDGDLEENSNLIIDEIVRICDDFCWLNPHLTLTLTHDRELLISHTATDPSLRSDVAALV